MNASKLLVKLEAVDWSKQNTGSFYHKVPLVEVYFQLIYIVNNLKITLGKGDEGIKRIFLLQLSCRELMRCHGGNVNN